MSRLTHAEYERLERAVIDGTRIVVQRAGGREHVLVPLKLSVRDGREAIEARNPTTGHDLTIFLDEVERIEVVR